MKLWIAISLIMVALQIGFVIGAWFATRPKFQDEIKQDELDKDYKCGAPECRTCYPLGFIDSLKNIKGSARNHYL